MKEELNIIVLKIADIGKELNRKFGTDSYEIRCKIFDIKDEISKLSQDAVIEPLPNPEHCIAKPLCDDRFCLKGERCNYDERQ